MILTHSPCSQRQGFNHISVILPAMIAGKVSAWHFHIYRWRGSFPERIEGGKWALCKQTIVTPTAFA